MLGAKTKVTFVRRYFHVLNWQLVSHVLTSLLWNAFGVFGDLNRYQMSKRLNFAT